ncbi:MAG: hypothetical protein ACRCUT_14100, partial [Spirochaetota bacterium]
MMTELTDEQIRGAVESGEFGGDVTGAAENVAVVMSQDWCPQWLIVKRWLEQLPESCGIRIFVTVYNQKDYYHEFMHFKETVFGNREIPYIRYYRNGALIKETNYTSKGFFLKSFEIQKLFLRNRSMDPMKAKLVFFDLDETITDRDTDILWAIWRLKKNP